MYIITTTVIIIIINRFIIYQSLTSDVPDLRTIARTHPAESDTQLSLLSSSFIFF